MAYGGNITATLTLDASKFNAAIKTAIAEVNNATKATSGSGNAFQNLQKSVNSSTAGMNKYLNEIQKVNTSLPGMTGYIKGLTTEIGSMSSAMSKVTPGNFAAMGKEVLNMGNGFQRLLPAVNNFWKDLDKATQTTKNLASNMQRMPLETYWTQAKNAEQLNKAVQEASSSTAALGRDYVPMATAAQKATATGASGFQRLGEGISRAGQGLNQFASSFVSFDIWMAGLVGGAFLNFTVGAAAAVDRSLQLMKFVGMSSGEVDRLNQSTKDYAKSAALVSQPEMLDAWRIVRLSAKMGGDQMIANNSTMGDTIALFKMQGRSATDAGRALEDAMSGNFMRFKEINIKQSDLIQAGWDGNRNNAMGFFAALQKIYQDRGIVGLANNTESVAAKFENVKEQVQLIGVAIGNKLLPTVSALLVSLLDLLSSPVGNALVMWGISATALGFTFALLLPIFGSVTLAIPRMIGMMVLWRGEMTFLQATSATSIVQLQAFGGVVGGLGSRLKDFVGMIPTSIAGLRALGVSVYVALGPWGILAALIIAAGAAFVIYGQKVGWFTTAQERANNALGQLKREVDSATEAQSAAQQEVAKWTDALSRAVPGTEGYKDATNRLAGAKSHLKDMENDLAGKTDTLAGKNEVMAGAVRRQAEAYTNLEKSLIAYSVASGRLTPEAAAKLVEQANNAAASVDNEATKMDEGTSKINDNAAANYAWSTKTYPGDPLVPITTSLDGLISRLHTAEGDYAKLGVLLGNPLPQTPSPTVNGINLGPGFSGPLGQWLTSLLPGYQPDTSNMGWGLPLPTMPKGNVTNPFGTGTTGGLLPQPVSAADGKKGGGFLNDIDPRNPSGIWRGTVIGDVATGKIKIPKWKFPNFGKIFEDLKLRFLKIFDILKLPDLSKIKIGDIPKMIGDKIKGVLNLPGDLTWEKLRGWVWDKILGFLGLPGGLSWEQVKNWVWAKISGYLGLPGGLSWSTVSTWVMTRVHGFLSWPVITIGQILGEIGKRISAFRWPWGPAPTSIVSSAVSTVQSVASRAAQNPIISGIGRVVGAMTPWGPPAGPLQDFMGGAMAVRAGVNPFSIISAANKGFSKGGVSAFTNVADAMESRVPNYRLYSGELYSDPQIWRNRFCNCMDGAELLLNENAQYFGLSGSMPRGYWGGWPHRWAHIGGKDFDFTNKQKHGTWAAHNDSSGSLLRTFIESQPGIARDILHRALTFGEGDTFDQTMESLGPNLRYIGYPGHAVDPLTALMGGGNCFDLTMGIMQLAQQKFGLPAKMKWGTYGGNSHVWANIGGKDYDLSRRALEGTYTPPPRGPAGGSPRGPGGIHLHFHEPVYGLADFEKTTEKMIDKIMDKTW